MKNLKHQVGMVALYAFTFLFFGQINGQNSADCEKIVLQVYEGINKKNGKPLEVHLSDRFEIAGQKGDIARLVFVELISKFNDKVSDIKKVSESKDDKLTLVFEAQFKDMGKQKSTFTFDKNNKLTNVELTPIIVKNQRK